MPWHIYNIQIQGRHDNYEHYHAVVVRVAGSALCIPSFTAGKTEVTENLAAFQRMGFFSHQCSVELDNSKHVTFYNGKIGHQSVWFIGKRQIISASVIDKLVPCGELDDHGMLQLMECFLECSKTKNDFNPPKFVRAVERAYADLRAILYPPPPPVID